MVDKIRFAFTEIDPNLGALSTLVVTANVEQFPPVELAFAWTRDRNAPLILGHMNFFLAFDVCFYRSELVFEINSKTI